MPLTKISLHNNTLLAIAKKITSNYCNNQAYLFRQEPEDLLNNLYIKLNEDNLNGKLNPSFIFKGDKLNLPYLRNMMRNLCVDNYWKVNKNSFKFNNLFLLDSPPINNFENDFDNLVIEDLLKKEIILNKVERLYQGLHLYERELLKLNIVEKISMRKLSKETGIPVQNIFITIKNAKLKLREKLESDYKKYKDYE